MLSTTNSVSVGATAALISRISTIISSSTCRRPAVSTISTSIQRAARLGQRFARQRRRRTCSDRTGRSRSPAAAASRSSCRIAAGRYTSVLASSTFLRSFSLSHFASLPAEVVLPAPCRPASRITTGGCARRLSGRTPSPISAISSSWMMRDQRLARRQALVDLLPDDLGADRLDERLDDRQRDVGLEQRHAHLAQRVGDVLVGQAPAAAQAFDDALQAFGQLVEHGKPDNGAQATGGSRQEQPAMTLLACSRHPRSLACSLQPSLAPPCYPSSFLPAIWPAPHGSRRASIAPTSTLRTAAASPASRSASSRSCCTRSLLWRERVRPAGPRRSRIAETASLIGWPIGLIAVGAVLAAAALRGHRAPC